MSTLARDFRYALRALAKSPGFLAAATLTLGIGIGANTVIFSVVDAVLLRPLPYLAPGRLVVLWEGRLSRPQERNVISAANFVDWKSQNNVFADMAISTWSGLTLVGSGPPERIAGRAVTANLFSVLGVSPELGRTFAPDEAAPGGAAAIVLSHGLWKRRFAGDTGIVGRAVRTSDGLATVVGVMPRTFRPLGTEEYWEPFRFNEDALKHWGRFAVGWARLKTGVPLSAAQAQMSQIARRLERLHPDFDAGWDVRVVPIAEDIAGAARPLLFVLGGAVALLFLLACVNIANLLVGRVLARGRETAIRTALGASRARIAGQWIAEGLILGLAGGAAGLAIAAWGLDVVAATAAGRIPRLEEAALGGRAIAFAAAVSAAVAIAFGLLPAARRAGGDLAAWLAGGTRTTAGRGAASWKAALAASQIAIALVLLVGAGLLARSLEALGRVPPGFDPAGVLTLRMTLPESRYATGQQQAEFFETLAARVRGLPGVAAAGVVNTPPLGGMGPGTTFTVVGAPAPAPADKPVADIRAADPGALAALGVPLLSGRGFASTDRAGTVPVVLVNRTLARRFFGNETPIGRRLEVAYGPPEALAPVTIAGVVGDVRLTSLDEPARPTIYYPTRQSPNSLMTLVVKSAPDAPPLLPFVRDELRRLDPNIPIERPATLESLLARSFEGRRLPMLFLGPFALAALALAAVGVYGVLALAVRERTREIGIRIALGARAGDVRRLVLGRAALVTGAGLAAGAAAALVATRAMKSLLFGVAPADPVTFAAVVAGVAAVALAASWLPARRAGRIDPMGALRNE